MSAGRKTMVRGNVLSANKGAPANERTFTERNEAVDAPRNFKEARTNVGLNGNAQEDLLDAYTELKLLTFQDKFSLIEKPIQPAKSTHSNTRLLLQFNLELQKGT